MVQAVEERQHGNIETDRELLKQTLDIVLDTLGLPQCDDIYKAREMIRDAVNQDRWFQEYIDKIIKLASNIVYGVGDK